MTSVKEALGEIDKRKVINKGDKIKVIFFEESSKKEVTGILLSTNNKEIEINGITPKKKISIDKIFSIEKISNC